jgi:hypothetical protein
MGLGGLIGEVRVLDVHVSVKVGKVAVATRANALSHSVLDARFGGLLCSPSALSLAQIGLRLVVLLSLLNSPPLLGFELFLEPLNISLSVNALVAAIRTPPMAAILLALRPVGFANGEDAAA